MKYYVDARQELKGSGSAENPFRTISEAALIAQPGDEVIVLPGIYREEVAPVRGGTSDEERIVFRSAEKGKAVITGGELLTGWEKHEGDIWKAKVDNAVFGGDNPFADPVYGDWYYYSEERPVHRGEIFLDGKSMYEVFSMEALAEAKPSLNSWDPEFSSNCWYAEVNGKETIIYVHLKEGTPAEHEMEYTARRHCFYPAVTGINYVTLSGFTVCKAATQWAPPTAYQEGMIGPHWSKGWIIEDCDVSESKCVGISLGKYLQPENENKWYLKGWKHGTQTERDAICQAQNEGWSKETIGSHIVRNCNIHDCGQAGIVGHLGCVFSLIENNHIHHINNKMELNGAEIGGIKLHAAIDTVIRANHFHHCTRGLWLDWQAQGTRVTGNCFHHNQPPAGCQILNRLSFGEDIFVEVSHGPTLIDNNLLLSICSAKVSTQGLAFVHNLIGGSFTFVGVGTHNAGLNHPESVRYTPYHVPHGTAVAGFMSILHGDAKFYNNLFVQQPVLPEWKEYAAQNDIDKLDHLNFICGTKPYDGYPTWEEYSKQFTRENIVGDRSIYYTHLPVWCEGNVYFNGACPADCETNAAMAEEKVSLNVVEKDGKYFLQTDLYEKLPGTENRVVTTEVLGMAFEPEQLYENADGTPLTIDTDLIGQPYGAMPLPGALAAKPDGAIALGIDEAR